MVMYCFALGGENPKRCMQVCEYVAAPFGVRHPLIPLLQEAHPMVRLVSQAVVRGFGAVAGNTWQACLSATSLL